MKRKDPEDEKLQELETPPEMPGVVSTDDVESATGVEVAPEVSGIVSSQDIESTTSREPLPEVAGIISSSDVESVREEKTPELQTNIPGSSDKETISQEKEPELNTNIPASSDKETFISEGNEDVPVNIAAAGDTEEIIPVDSPPDVPVEIFSAKEMEGVAEDTELTDIPVNIAPGEDKELVTAQHTFNGQWLPDLDPLEIGADNFKTLTNLRPGDGHPEGVHGYSKINTTPLSTYLKIRSGHQLLTDRDTASYVLVQAENSGKTASEVLVNKTAIPSQGNFVEVELHTANNAASDPQGDETNATTGWAGDGTGGTIASSDTDPNEGTYHFIIAEASDTIGEGAIANAGTLPTVAHTTYILTVDEKVTAGSWTFDIRNSADSATIATLETEVDDATYTSKTYEWTAAGTNERLRITIDTAANGQIYVDNISVRAKALHSDASGAGLGRFSNAPGGNVAYCNEQESCIWAGEEMRVAGLFTVGDIETSATDLTFANAPETITTGGAVNWLTEGYEPGQYATITACSVGDNVIDVTIIGVTATVITVEQTLTAGGAGTGTMTISIVVPRKNPIDYTESVNNALTTAGNVATIGGGIDTDTVLMLHCDGVNGSTTFTDSSASAHTLTANGAAQLSTANKKYGSASGVFDDAVAADYVAVPDHENWNFGANEFTIDFWFKYENAFPVAGIVFGQIDAAHGDGANRNSYYMELSKSGGFRVITFKAWEGGSQLVRVSGVWADSLVLGTWYHVALIRGWGNAVNDWAITLNGALSDGGGSTTTDNSVMPDWDQAFTIGSGWDTQTTTVNMGMCFDTAAATGYIDEFKVTKGLARWTAEFTPQSSQYVTERLQWYTFSTRPLKGIQYTIPEPNGATSTSTVKTWNGSSLSSITLTNDGTSSGGASMGQDGEMLFSSTVDIARPFHFEGLYLYVYLTELTAGAAGFSQVEANAPFQQIGDVWDGIYRQPIQFQVYVVASETYKDYTLEVNYPADAGTSIGGELDSLATTEHVIVMFEERMAGFYFTMYPGEENTETARPTIERWNGTQYVTCGDIIDGTIEDPNTWESLGKTGLWSWNPPDEAEEQKQTLFGTTGYAYKISFDGALHTAVTVDLLYGIPAQQTVRPFKFSTMYKNQLMLCGYTEGKEANRVDYCLPNAPDVWNGFLSSMDGLQSLYFGGSEALNCAVQLYNRFGANIYSTLVTLKNNETYLLVGESPADYRIYPISLNVGCAAPLTLVAAEAGFEIAKDIVRNIAIWLSYSGPVLFDGAVMSPLRGIESYFDPHHANYITMSSIAEAHGWYDSNRSEYNLIIPADDLWFVYQFARKKWFLKDTNSGEFIHVGFPVIDSYGVQHIYGAIDTGYMMRLENGNTWHDGTANAITQTLETGDFFPTGSSWDVTRLHRIKVMAIDTTEAISLGMTHYAETTKALSTSATDLTFVAGPPGTITTGGLVNWVTEGFAVGQYATITDCSVGANKKNVTLTGVSTTVLTIEQVLTAGGAGSGTMTIVSGTSLTTLVLNSGSNRVVRSTQRRNLLGWSHRMKFAGSSSAEDKGIQLIGWGYEYSKERNDE